MKMLNERHMCQEQEPRQWSGVSFVRKSAFFPSTVERVRKEVCFPGGSDGKESSNARDTGSIPGLGRSPREGNGSPLQYSCLENSMNRGA